MAKKKTAKTKPSSKSKPTDTRTLTREDRKKIQRLLKTAELGKVRLAIELTEKTCSDADLSDIYTDEIILSMISSGDVELFAVTASFFLRHREHWDRFLQCATNNRVLTGTAMLNRTADLSDFTAITVEAAALGPCKMTTWGDDAELDGLSTISLEVARQLVLHSSNLSLNGLTALPDDIAVVLATHAGDGVKLNGLTSLSDAAAESLSKFTGGDSYFEGLYLDGLTSLSDAAAKSFGKHQGQLNLNGLTSLSDAAAKGLSKHQGELSLNGTTHLSEVAAKHLSQHEDKLSLYGLSDLSDEAALAFANKKTLQTNEIIDAQIVEATKTFTATSATLTPAERKKIKKLINVEHLATACELLKSADAKEGDWLAVFSKSKIKSLVDTWDATTWNTLVAEMQPFPKVYELLKATLEKRINYNGSDPSVYGRFGDSLRSVLNSSSDDLKSLIDTLLTSNGMRSTIGRI